MGLVMSIGPSLAHHSGNMFDKEREVEVEGVVKEFQFTNPHSWLIVDVTNADGTVTTWGFEALAPNALMRAGLSKGDLAAGTRLTITGHPIRDGRTVAVGITATRADGVAFSLTPGR